MGKAIIGNREDFPILNRIMDENKIITTKHQWLEEKDIKKMKIVNYHTTRCTICKEMSLRGYRSESKYFDDLFVGKLKPVKYRLFYTPSKGKNKGIEMEIK